MVQSILEWLSVHASPEHILPGVLYVGDGNGTDDSAWIVYNQADAAGILDMNTVVEG